MLARISWWLFILVAVVLSFKSLTEPDIWWMLRTGDWIWAEKSIPTVDVFSYTHEGVAWINVKWLFEVLIATFSALFGAESVLLLQAMVTVSIIYLAYAQSRAQMLRLVSGYSQERHKLAFLWWGILALMAIDFRLIGRPEMISHLFTMAYLLIFAQYEQTRNPKQLVWLIPIQILWANMHEAFGIGMVLMLIFLSGEWLRYGLGRFRAAFADAMPLKASAFVLIACLSVALHPYGLSMIAHPFNIFGQLQENKFTTELANVFSPLYWQVESYLNLLFLLSAVVGMLLAARRQQGAWLDKLLTTISPSQILIFGALFYLSLTAYRNIPFFIFASWSWSSFVGYSLIQSRLVQRFGDKFVATKVIAISLGLYIGVISGVYHQYWRGEKSQYGLQVLSSHNPIGAAEFIAENKLQKTRAYADYLTSSYLLWRLSPDFRTYIDLRDLDIFPSSFFQTFAATTVMPEAYQKEDSTYNFNYAVVYRPQFSGLHYYLSHSEQYDLVFIDPIAAIYVKNTSENAPIIGKYGFKANGKRDIFSALPSNPSSGFSFGISKALNPLFNNNTIDSSHQNLIAAEFYQNIEEFGLAEQRALRALKSAKTDKWRAHEQLGGIYNAQIGTATDPSQRQKFIENAQAEYGKALKINPDAINALIGKGLVAFQMGQFAEAINALQRAHKLEPDNFSAVKYLAYSYKVRYFNESQSVENLDNWLGFSKKMDKMNPNNPFIYLDLGLAYCQRNECEPSLNYLNKVSTFPQFSPDEKGALDRCIQKCGGKK
jgi:tetratricopeptide (TPR) repeat protein